MRPIFQSRALTAASGNAICLSQTPGGAVALTLNGALVTAGVATLDSQRVVGITSAANETARTFILTGQDESGQTITESITGANIGTSSSVLNYKKVTSITVDAATAGAITVGTTGVGSAMPVVLDRYISPFNPTLAVEVTGTINYDVQYTMDDPFAASFLTTATVWTSITALTGQTAYKDASLSAPVSAVRLKTNSGTGTGKFIVMQPGIGGL